MSRTEIPDTPITWGTVRSLLNTMLDEIYKFQHFGIYNYDASAEKTTAIPMALADTWYKITNDTAGGSTLKAPLPGVADVWNPTTDQFDFSGLDLWDIMEIRIDLIPITTSPNIDVDVSLFLNAGGTEIELPFIAEQNFKAAAEHRVLRYNGIFYGSTLTKDNPAELRIRSSGAGGSFKVNGFYCVASKRMMEYVAP